MRRVREALATQAFVNQKILGAKDRLNRHSLDFKWTVLKREGSHLTMQTREAESCKARLDRERAHLWTGDLGECQVLERHQV